MFAARIFIPDKTQKPEMAFSEKVKWYSLAIAFTMSLVICLLEYLGLEDYTAFPGAVVIIAFFCSMVAKARHNSVDYEIVSGHFSGEMLQMDGSQIVVGDVVYLFRDLFDIQVTIHSYHGQPTYNSYGPAFHQGVSNILSFTCGSELHKAHFGLKTARQRDELCDFLAKLPVAVKVIRIQNLI